MARGNTKAAAAKPRPARPKPTKEPESQNSSRIPLELQQKCLNVFRDALKPDDGDSQALQEVKGHLYSRDFAAAFGKEEYLRVYASRWSPSRALGYLQVFTDVQETLLDESQQPSDARAKELKIVCIGGGAGAEVAALGGWIHLENTLQASRLGKLHARFVDIAAWHKVVGDLHKTVVTPPELSKYASAAAKEANSAIALPEAYTADFEQVDALELSDTQLQELFGDSNLVTLMFTLNELYSTSMAKTQQILAQVTANLRPGAHLLVVDSPGSYSTITINGAQKKYPMQWLLDYTLIGPSQNGADPRNGAKWEKLVSDDSRWFRLPQGLHYPIELENMRYQIHLYRRLEDV